MIIFRDYEEKVPLKSGDKSSNGNSQELKSQNE